MTMTMRNEEFGIWDEVWKRCLLLATDLYSTNLGYFEFALSTIHYCMPAEVYRVSVRGRTKQSSIMRSINHTGVAGGGELVMG